jgi:hypothetical protein
VRAAAIVVLVLLVAPFAGYGIGRSIDDGLSALPPDQQAAGEAALRFAAVMMST